ncbi:MAG: hypothetical protein AB4372_21425 [Xenococcus sp. (in: cyanobacteria)]
MAAPLIIDFLILLKPPSTNPETITEDNIIERNNLKTKPLNFSSPSD